MLDLPSLNLVTILAAIGAVLAAVWGIYAKGRKSKANDVLIDRLKAEQDTRERIDNAKPADNVDDARANLTGFLRRKDK